MTTVSFVFIEKSYLLEYHQQFMAANYFFSFAAVRIWNVATIECSLFCTFHRLKTVYRAFF